VWFAHAENLSKTTVELAKLWTEYSAAIHRAMALIRNEGTRPVTMLTRVVRP